MKPYKTLSRPIASLTNDELSRRYFRLIRLLYSQFEGGRSFGIDWNTARECYPDIVSECDQLKAEALRRKSL
jgi:hypothetical protein